MKVLVTGANGFLGRGIVAAFLEHGHEVRALVRPTAQMDGIPWRDRVEIVRADLRNHNGLAAFFDGVDVLVHLAATVTADDDTHFNCTVVGTERLLQAMAGTQTRRLVLASSFSVYGWSQAKGVFDETTALETNVYERGGYAVAKLWQERVARRFSEERQWGLTVMRPGIVWGPGHESVPGAILSLGPLRFVFGVGRQVPLTYIDNCAESFVLAVERVEQSEGQTFNVVDPERVTAWRYAGQYIAKSGIGGVRVPLPYICMAVLARCADLTRKLLFGSKGRLPSMLTPRRVAFFKPLRFSSRKLTEQLGWQPLRTFEQACDRCFNGDKDK